MTTGDHNGRLPALVRAGGVLRLTGLGRGKLEALAVDSDAPVRGRVRYRRIGRHRYFLTRDVLVLIGEG